MGCHLTCRLATVLDWLANCGSWWLADSDTSCRWVGIVRTRSWNCLHFVKPGEIACWITLIGFGRCKDPCRCLWEVVLLFLVSSVGFSRVGISRCLQLWRPDVTFFFQEYANPLFVCFFGRQFESWTDACFLILRSPNSPMVFYFCFILFCKFSLLVDTLR